MSQTFKVSPEIFQKIPNACFGVVVIRGIDNRCEIPEIGQFFETVQKETYEKLKSRKAKEYPPIFPYREAFQSLGINPNKFPPSIEALISRIEKGKTLPSINPIVDLGNAISLKYAIPLGAHDLNASAEALEVRLSTAQDQFIPFGTHEPEAIEPEEILYVSGHQVKTRRWIWRQSEFGKITPESTNIFFPLDGIEPINGAETTAARDELATLLEKYFGASPFISWVNQNSPTCSF